MKTLTLLASISLAFSLILSFSPASADWIVENVTPVGYDSMFTSLDLKSSGVPCIAYLDWFDNAQTGGLRFAYNEDGTWIIDHVNETYLTNLWMKLDHEGKPHIVTSTNGGNINYYSKPDSQWSCETVYTASDVGHVCLDFDSNNNPHISLFDNDAKQVIHVYKKGTTWTNEVVASDVGLLSPYGETTRICIDTNDIIYILYEDTLDSWSNSYILACYNGLWTYTPIFNGPTWEASMTLDSQDNIHVLTCSWDTYYIHKEDGEWISEFIGDGVSDYASLGIDNNFNKHASVFRTLEGLFYYYGDDTGWQYELISTSEWVGRYCSLALFQDSPRFSCLSVGQNYLMYYYQEILTNITLTSLNARYIDEKVILSWQFSGCCSDISGFNIYRLKKGINKQRVLLNTKPITGSSPLSYVDTSVSPRSDYIYYLTSLSMQGEENELGSINCRSLDTGERFAINNIYPQPATTGLNCLLSVNHPGMVTIIIFDLTGRMIRKHQVQTSSSHVGIYVDTNSLPSGVYILKACDGANTDTKRFLISNK